MTEKPTSNNNLISNHKATVNKDIIILAQAPPQWLLLCTVSLPPRVTAFPLHRNIYNAV